MWRVIPLSVFGLMVFCTTLTGQSKPKTIELESRGDSVGMVVDRVMAHFGCKIRLPVDVESTDDLDQEVWLYAKAATTAQVAGMLTNASDYDIRWDESTNTFVVSDFPKRAKPETRAVDTTEILKRVEDYYKRYPKTLTPKDKDAPDSEGEWKPLDEIDSFLADMAWTDHMVFSPFNGRVVLTSDPSTLDYAESLLAAVREGSSTSQGLTDSAREWAKIASVKWNREVVEASMQALLIDTAQNSGTSLVLSHDAVEILDEYEVTARAADFETFGDVYDSVEVDQEATLSFKNGCLTVMVSGAQRNAACYRVFDLMSLKDLPEYKNSKDLVKDISDALDAHMLAGYEQDLWASQLGYKLVVFADCRTMPNVLKILTALGWKP